MTREDKWEEQKEEADNVLSMSSSQWNVTPSMDEAMEERERGEVRGIVLRSKMRKR